MKTFLTILLLGLAAFTTQAAEPAAPRDSIIVKMAGKSRIIIYGENKEDLKKMMNYDLNRLLRDLKVEIDTISDEETHITLEDRDGRKYAKKEGISIRINRNNEKDVDVSIETDNDTLPRPQGTTRDWKVWRERQHQKERRREWWKNDRDNYVFSLGINPYGRNNSGTGYHINDYDLRPISSRYVSLGFYRNPTLIKGSNVALQLRTGFEVMWYNFMFEGNNVIRKGTDAVSFPENMTQLKKSKLAVTYLNVPLMPMVAFRRGAVSHIGVGAYASYRVDSYLKTRDLNKNRVREHANFYLNDFRYGLQAEIGFRNSLDFFVQYDLNTLYQAGRGPDVQVASFGFRFN